MTIEVDLQKCIKDTHDYINVSASNRIKIWVDYPLARLIIAIQTAIRVKHNMELGWETHRRGGTSLEDIVLKYECFTAEDKKIAKRTLGV